MSGRLRSGRAATPRVHVVSLADADEGAAVPVGGGDLNHLRRVLRLADGAAVELFDDAGLTAAAVLSGNTATVTAVEAAAVGGLVVAAAVPKGQRADWMVEKLCALGAAAWVRLACERSAVRPGAGKFDRYRRVAVEAAKQSRRAGVLRVEPMVGAIEFLTAATAPPAVLTTQGDARSAVEVLAKVRTVLVGPEGGWGETELKAFADGGCGPVTLGPTVLRVETAAVAAAAVWASVQSAS